MVFCAFIVLCFSVCFLFCFVLFCFLNLPWERGLDTAVQPDCYSGRAALWLKRISLITNRSEEANQSAVPAWELYVSARQRGVWTLRTGGWCWDLGTYKRSLESSHCCSYSERERERERETSLFPSEWFLFFLSFFLENDRFHSCLLPLERFSCISCSWFPHCLFWPSRAWHPVGVDKHLQFLHSSGK